MRRVTWSSCSGVRYSSSIRGRDLNMQQKHIATVFKMIFMMAYVYVYMCIDLELRGNISLPLAEWKSFTCCVAISFCTRSMPHGISNDPLSCLDDSDPISMILFLSIYLNLSTISSLFLYSLGFSKASEPQFRSVTRHTLEPCCTCAKTLPALDHRGSKPPSTAVAALEWRPWGF